MNDNYEVDLFAGDHVQVEGDVLVIETVGTKSAEGIPLNGGELRGVPNPYPKHLVLKRGRIGDLTKTDTQPKVKKLPPHMTLLEPGDYLCHGGKPCTVVSVTDKAAVIGDMDGNEVADKRLVNTVCFDTFECGGKNRKHIRLDEGQRAEHLKDFLARRKSPPVGEQKEQPSDETTQSESEENMSKKAKVKKVKAERKPKAAKAANGARFKIMGQSPCRVLVSLGRAGVNSQHAIAIMAAQGAKMSDATVIAYSYDGRAGKGNPAELTKAQVSELVASAKDPKAEK